MRPNLLDSFIFCVLVLVAMLLAKAAAVVADIIAW